MKPADDKSRAARPSFRHSLSFQLMFRLGSQSPERRSKPQPVLNASRVLFALHGLGALSTVKLVKVKDFADLDLLDLLYLEQQLRDAETIYLVINEYDWRNLTFHFNEDFDSTGSTHSLSFFDALPSAPQRNVAQTTLQRNKTPTRAQHEAHGTPQSRLPEPDITPRHDALAVPDVVSPDTLDSLDESPAHLSHRDTNTSLSSGELLSRLDTSLRSSTARNLGVGNLTAGLDSQLELPVMLYTVHDRDSQNTRWLVYEALRRPQRPQVPAPTYAAARQGSNLATSVALLPREQRPPLLFSVGQSPGELHLLYEGSSSGNLSGRGLSHMLRHLSSGPLRLSGPMSSHVLGRDSLGDPNPYDVYPADVYPDGYPADVALPARSITQDTHDKQVYHYDMYRDEKAVGTPAHEQRLLYVSWPKFAGLMVMGLVAVPIFFLVALGFFDYGGYIEHNPYSIYPDDKSVGVKLRYFRKYSRAQKIVSLVLGIVWILVVLAMVAVGFGVGLSSIR